MTIYTLIFFVNADDDDPFTCRNAECDNDSCKVKCYNWCMTTYNTGIHTFNCVDTGMFHPTVMTCLCKESEEIKSNDRATVIKFVCFMILGCVGVSLIVAIIKAIVYRCMESTQGSNRRSNRRKLLESFV